MLTSILAAAIDQCREPIHKDHVIQELEAKFIELIKQLPQDAYDDMETVFGNYEARIIKIAYLQGMQDFFNLFFTLSDEANEIIAGYDKNNC